jgi:hypothetical protein
MQVTTVNFAPDVHLRDYRPESQAERNFEIAVPPPENKARAQLNTDVLAMGNGAGSEDLRAAQQDWQRLQAQKATAEVKQDQDQAQQTQNATVAADLQLVALAAQSGNAIGVLEAQQRLAQHMLKL